MKFDASVSKDLVSALEESLKEWPGNLGIVEAISRAKRDGNVGLLVWHYVFNNEISFVGEDGLVESLYTSVGDSLTESEFGRLTEELGL